MDALWLILGIVLMLVGFLGCFLPLLPGPPLCYVALLLLHLRSDVDFTIEFLMLWAITTFLVTIFDYVFPLYSTKIFGGTKYGMWGSTVGLLVGFWFGPFGILFGTLMGAFIGEWISDNNAVNAYKAAIGSFIGFLVGTFLKLVICVAMFYYFIESLWK